MFVQDYLYKIVFIFFFFIVDLCAERIKFKLLN